MNAETLHFSHELETLISSKNPVTYRILRQPHIALFGLDVYTHTYSYLYTHTPLYTHYFHRYGIYITRNSCYRCENAT